MPKGAAIAEASISTSEVRVDLNEAARAESLETEIDRIAKMSLPELRQAWASRWGLPPRFRSTELLRQLVAWRVQAEHFGGLDAETKTLLRRSSMPKPRGPPPGSRLTREFRGILHHVDVGEHAFTYMGASYGSLSEVARVITGTRWNGPRFFGLRDPRPIP